MLEIGTGTGWNAALLAHRLGAGNVTTVEVDPAVSAEARTELNVSGLPVRVVHGGGLKGYPEDAPYNRVIVVPLETRFRNFSDETGDSEAPRHEHWI